MMLNFFTEVKWGVLVDWIIASKESCLLVSEVKVAQLCPTLCDPMDYTVHGILQPRIPELVAFPFSRGFPNPGIEPRSPALQVDSLPAESQGSLRIMEWVAYPFSSGSSWHRNQTGVSCTAGGFFTNWARREELCLLVKFISIKRRLPGHFLFSFAIPQ